MRSEIRERRVKVYKSPISYLHSQLSKLNFMKLERYIKNNREEFETYEPSAKLWKGIEHQLDEKFPETKKATFRWNSVSSLSKIAASLVILLGFGYFGLNKWQANQRENAELAALNPAYAKQVNQYTSFISEKREELKNLAAEDPALYQQFNAELKHLDESYKLLKAELPKNPNQEELLQAMLQNLQWQMDLLTQQLQIIQKMKKAKNDKSSEMV